MRGTVVLAVILVSCGPSLEPLHHEQVERLRRIAVESGLDPHDNGAAVSRTYRDHVEPLAARLAIPQASSTTLADVFDAAVLAHKYPPEARYVRMAATAGDEMMKRGIFNEDRVRTLQKLFIAAEDLTRARALSSYYPAMDLEAIPEVRGEAAKGTLRVLVPSQDGRLQLRSLDAFHGRRILAVTDPLCGPSRRAVAALMRDPELGLIFAKHARLVKAFGYSLNVSSVRDWNRAHPDLPYQYVLSRADFPGIDFAGTPHFYFLEDGVVKADVAGWPGSNGHRAEFKLGLQSIGLRPGVVSHN